ncbi:protein FAM185A isoform X2 [Kryptolebias marmoratus]|uniref:protein FAM185A isoform X2 n=1 Tax=Kryptolebias marmoratus TaxID=37003 RepID=UPI0018ACD110|nr:protein FAM185A isoform X2 [Kryptolebias marmoratus]
MFAASAARRRAVGLLRRRGSLTLSRGCLTPSRCPLQPSRSCSSSAPESPPARGALQRWDLSVSPFTTVRARLACDITVRPLDPHAYPEADRAFVTVSGPSGDRNQADCLNHLRVHYDEQSKDLLISTQKVSSDVTIEVEAPIKSNVFITAEGGGSVEVQKMECDVCRVQTQKGSCLLHSVKGHQVEVLSHGGHVTGLGTIHGNVDISARGDGAVNVKKLQGTTMNVSTEHGSLKVKAIYGESNCVFSCSGRVEVGHAHDGSNSFLKISSKSGDIDAYVGDGGTAELHSQEGAVSVRVPSSLRVGVNLCGASVDVSPEVVLHRVENYAADGCATLTGCLNGEFPADRWVKARADRGAVKLRTQSWFESLKIGS